MGLISANAPLVEFRRPSGSCTDDASSASLDRSAFSGLSAPMTHPADEVRFTRALPARHLPSSGFGHPLDGFLPRRPCRPCFMPAAPIWGFPFGAFSSLEVARRFCRCVPRLPFPRIPLAEPKLNAARFEDRLPGTASSESLAAARVFSPTSAGGSLGFSPSQGSQVSTLARASASLLPRACPPRWLPIPTFRASESRSIDAALDHEGQAPLSGFCTSTSLAFGHSANPGLWIRRTPRCTSPCGSSRVP
jgi:hypothetical protein